jgi:hypothetical protein
MKADQVESGVLSMLVLDWLPATYGYYTMWKMMTGPA